MYKLILTIGLISLFFYGCSEKNNEDQLYIGSYRSLDQLIPYPYIFQQTNDKLFLYNNEGNLVDSTFSQGIKKGDTFGLGSHLFYLKYMTDSGFIVFDLLDTSNFFYNQKLVEKKAAKFRHVENNTLSIDLFEDQLKNNLWSYDVPKDENSTPNFDLRIEKCFNFKSDSLVIQSNYYYQDQAMYSEFQVKSYKLFQIGGNVFLSIIGDSENPQPIYQINKGINGKIVLTDYSSRYEKEIELNHAKMTLSEFNQKNVESKRFSRCFDGYQGEYYFGRDVTYNKGNEYLKKMFNEGFPSNESSEGYIIIHFNINCNSQVGDIGLIQMDRDYERTTFSKESISFLIRKVTSLSDWPSTQSEDSWLDYKDVHAFLMFKIEDSKIVDVCP